MDFNWALLSGRARLLSGEPRLPAGVGRVCGISVALVLEGFNITYEHWLGEPTFLTFNVLFCTMGIRDTQLGLCEH